MRNNASSPQPLRLAESTMLEVQPRDKRGFFILPQAPEDAGYSVYGTPGRGGRANMRTQT